jgi:hypothetical protein
VKLNIPLLRLLIVAEAVVLELNDEFSVYAGVLIVDVAWIVAGIHWEKARW